MDELLTKVKANLILEHTADDALIQSYITAAVSYAESYQHIPEGTYQNAPMPPTTEQAVIMLASHFYESRDGSTGGFFADNIEFDYDLWTTGNGKCMVRVKITGEVTEVDREVMKILRLEEKQMRRGFTSSDPDDAKPQTILSLDVVNEEEVEGPAWLIDPHDYIQESATKRWIIAFRKTLTANQREVFDKVILGGMSVRKFAKLKGCNHKSVLETKNAVCKKIKNNF